MKEYAGVEYLDNAAANELLINAIEGDRPFLAGRIGGTEISAINIYDNPLRSLQDFRLYTNTICELSGFFPKNPILIKRFCNLYKKSMDRIDYFAAFNWDNEEKYAQKGRDLNKTFSSYVLDPFCTECSWYEALKDKTILVVHPFAKSISTQYRDNRERIVFPYDRTMPECNIKVMEAVQSLGGVRVNGYKDWFEALEDMKEKVAAMEYDVALLACGAYGIPLGAHIKDIGRKAIYVGGCLQLFFGIIGSRWENDERVTPYINDNWIRPLEAEKPKDYMSVEGGCYW